MGNQDEMYRNFQRLPSFPDCFVCGLDNPKGLHAEFYSDGIHVKADFTPNKHVLGYSHIVHGGIIASLMDDAIIWAAYVRNNRFGVTAELNIRFVKPLIIEKKYVIEARLMEDKGKIWILEARICDKDGNLYSKARGKVVPIPADQNEEMKRYMSC